LGANGTATDTNLAAIEHSEVLAQRFRDENLHALGQEIQRGFVHR
jgi:hypothetical protein